MLFASPNGDGAGGLLLPGLIILMIVGMYFLMIRPQNKRRKEMMDKQRTAGTGQTVVTIGGLHGTIIDADDSTVTLEVSPGVMCVYERGAIARIVDEDSSTEADETEEVDETPEAEVADVVEETSEEVSADKAEADDKPKAKKGKSFTDGTQN
ncbi:MAG: preprotein translocase subunit YajC [Stackebrandtia sp.]